MPRAVTLQHLLAGVTAAFLVGAAVLPGHAETGPVGAAAAALARGEAPGSGLLAAARATRAARSEAEEALAVLAAAVERTSHPRALADAFRSYYAYRAAHPETAANRHLYFVDYGLPSTTPRGYVFDMQALTVVEGPFTVAHGRGSAATRDGVPRRFSNAAGSQATSLGLYVAQELYGFRARRPAARTAPSGSGWPASRVASTETRARAGWWRTARRT
jgi:hypothetical protein